MTPCDEHHPGRRFKASTFALPNRHTQRQYMLAIDAARTSGFRDSLYYFRRNPLAFKLNATQAEKDYLIAEGKLGSHLRTRNVTLITARSAYKMHGSKMLIGKVPPPINYLDLSPLQMADGWSTITTNLRCSKKSPREV